MIDLPVNQVHDLQVQNLFLQYLYKNINKFDFVHDEVYSGVKNTSNPYDNTVNISPYFFDMMN